MSMLIEESESVELPTGWTAALLPQICEINPAKPRADEVLPTTPVTFVPMPAVNADAGAITAPKERPFGEVRKGFTFFRDDDVIIAKITPCFENGKAAIARGLLNGMGFGSTEFHVLRSNGTVLPEYLYFFIRQDTFRREGAENMTGSVGQKRVPADFMSNVVIPLPPLAEQTRIVAKVEEVLARVNAARERLAKAPIILKRFRHAVVAAACSGYFSAEWRISHGEAEIVTDELPERWRVTTVGDVIQNLKYGTSQKCDYSKKGVPVLRIPNIGDGVIERLDLKYGPLDKQEFEHLRLQAGDVLLIRSNGSVSLLGKAALVGPADTDSAYAGYLIRLRPDRSKVMPEYLNMVLGSFHVRLQIELPARSTSGVNNINSDEVRALPINLPPLAEQREIMKRVGQVLVVARKIEERVAAAAVRAEKMVQATLAKAFRGELVATEAELAEKEGREYETAAQLLERIRAKSDSDSSADAPKRRKQKDTVLDPGPAGQDRPAKASKNPKEPADDGDGEITYDNAMACIRDAFTEGGARDREQAIHDVSQTMGIQRLSNNMRQTIAGCLKTAVRRGILNNEKDGYSLAARTAADYTRDHLIDTLMASIDGTWTTREDAIRATAKHLGFRKAGPAFKEEMKSAINGSIRRGQLEHDGDLVRKAK